MGETAFGVRSYTCSEKTKRPQKTQLDSEKLEKRNSRQRTLYISLENIDEIFSDNERWPVCYAMMFNLIQGKVTKFFKTRSYDRKKELSYDCMNRLYSILKRKLLKLKETTSTPVLCFYLSQFFRYIELVVFSTVVYGTQDCIYMIQEPENFKTEDVLNNYLSIDSFICAGYEPEDTVDCSDKIKECIETNDKLDKKEKLLLLKIYKKAYSFVPNVLLTKRETDMLNILKLRMEYEPDLLNGLEEILDGARESE